VIPDRLEKALSKVRKQDQLLRSARGEVNDLASEVSRLQRELAEAERKQQGAAEGALAAAQ
jgi:uncharacterized protein YlxW (UPF0749 family)